MEPIDAPMTDEDYRHAPSSQALELGHGAARAFQVPFPKGHTAPAQKGLGAVAIATRSGGEDHHPQGGLGSAHLGAAGRTRGVRAADTINGPMLLVCLLVLFGASIRLTLKDCHESLFQTDFSAVQKRLRGSGYAPYAAP